MSDTYIHYGSQNFDVSLMEPIQNRPGFNKPSGGLWASREDADYGWKDWNEVEEYVICDEDNAFSFKISRDAKIYTIDSMESAKNFIDTYGHSSMSNNMIDLLPDFMISIFSDGIDFEKVQQDGYDGIEMTVSAESALKYMFSGWDCDSIIIFNPGVIEPVKDKDLNIDDADWDENRNEDIAWADEAYDTAANERGDDCVLDDRDLSV